MDPKRYAPILASPFLRVIEVITTPAFPPQRLVVGVHGVRGLVGQWVGHLDRAAKAGVGPAREGGDLDRRTGVALVALVVATGWR